MHIWNLGVPGAGKSTSAQLLARNHGFIYYEGDCFMYLANPFVDVNANEPSLSRGHQTPLKVWKLK